MKGVPYWGEDTYADIRYLTKEIENVKGIKEIDLAFLTKQALEEGFVIEPITDMYNLFLVLQKLNALLYVEDFSPAGDMLCSWVRDIRFNYRDKHIFLPYYTYERKEVKVQGELYKLDVVDEVEKIVSVKHLFEMKKYVIDNRVTKERVPYLYIILNAVEGFPVIYKLNIVSLNYLDGVETVSLKDLHTRYLNAAYKESTFAPKASVVGYSIIDLPKNKNYITKEQKLRQRHELKRYTKTYCNIEYNDMRVYDVETLWGSAILIEADSYTLRRYTFEAYLYCIFAKGVTELVEESYALDFKALCRGKKAYLTYSSKEDGAFPIVLKHYYCDEIKLRRKSYERYC